MLVLVNIHMLKKIKNLREQNFEVEANNKQLDSEDIQQSNFSNLISKLNFCAKYSDSLICFHCA